MPWNVSRWTFQAPFSQWIIHSESFNQNGREEEKTRNDINKQQLTSTKEEFAWMMIVYNKRRSKRKRGDQGINSGASECVKW